MKTPITTRLMLSSSSPTSPWVTEIDETHFVQVLPDFHAINTETNRPVFVCSEFVPDSLREYRPGRVIRDTETLEKIHGNPVLQAEVLAESKAEVQAAKRAEPVYVYPVREGVSFKVCIKSQAYGGEYFSPIDITENHNGIELPDRFTAHTESAEPVIVISTTSSETLSHGEGPTSITSIQILSPDLVKEYPQDTVLCVIGGVRFPVLLTDKEKEEFWAKRDKMTDMFSEHEGYLRGWVSMLAKQESWPEIYKARQLKINAQSEEK
jgi:hypothetical protein